MALNIWSFVSDDLWQDYLVPFTPYVIVGVTWMLLAQFIFYPVLYFSVVIVNFYHLKDTIFRRDPARSGALRTLFRFYNFLTWVWFGHDVSGMDNIPDEGPVMIIYYHGAAAFDFYGLLAKIYLVKGRLIHSVADHFFFKFWGVQTFLRALQFTPGSQDSCSQVLESGNILILSPGGAYEAQFGDANYEILWRDRTGFTKIALRTKCKIIPVFTENIREAFRVPKILVWFFRPRYEQIRLLGLPVYGGFPVKLRTVIGSPIEYDTSACGTPEELRDVCKAALQKLIDDNQEKPGSILRGLYQRRNDYFFIVAVIVGIVGVKLFSS